MASIRQEKVANLLKRDLSEILRVQSSTLTPGKMLTVTVVRMAPDLSFAKVYVSVFPSSDAAKDVKAINDHKSEIRGILGKKIGKQVRIVPEIAFALDDSLDFAERIDELLQ
jgi:ribosome-binding factor A